MKKQKFRDIDVYLEGPNVAVTVSKIIKEPYSSDSKQYIVRQLPFRYKVRYSGSLSVGDSKDVVELHKGQKVVVTPGGRITVSSSHKAKNGKAMICVSQTLNLFLGDYVDKF